MLLWTWRLGEGDAVKLAAVGAVLVAVIALAAAGNLSSGKSAASSADIQGDADCSGVINEQDALGILVSFARVGDTAPCVDAAGDVDCDLVAGPADALRVIRFVAGAAAATPAGCTPIGEPVEPPSSFDRIDMALAGGSIDEETALVYSVYAMFQDDRLPDQYRGDDSGGPPDNDSLNEAAFLFDTLSPQAQGLLAPFLIPPIYEGSWLNPQASATRAPAAAPPAVCPGADPDWRCVDGATADVRVWWQTRYPGDEARAQEIAGAMDGTIWPVLTGLIGQPLSDAGVAQNGGSGSVDFWMVDAARSATPAYSAPGCKKTPSYVLLGRGETFDVVAHEFMHVLQWTFDVSNGCMYQPNGDYNWLAEATATWAQSFVYPETDEEHYIAEWYIDSPGKPLETRDDRHEYGAYLFFLRLSEELGGGQVVRDAWDNTEQYSSLEAVDRALPGGFATQWPAYAGCLWNTPPVDCYAQWDELPTAAAQFVSTTAIGLGGQSTRSVALDAGVEHLGASYFAYEFTDSAIESVVFRNTLVDYPHASVQALVKVDSAWKLPLDWTGQGTASYCVDYEGQDIEELVILVANSDWELKSKLLPPEPPTLMLSDVGCSDYVGTARADMYWSTVPDVKFKVVVTDLRFARYDTVGSEALYALVDSSPATWYASGMNGPCTVSGQMPLGPAERFSVGDIQGELTINLDDGTYRIEITGYDPDAIVTTSCPGTDPMTDPWPYMSIVEDGNISHPQTDDNRLHDDYSTDLFLYSGRWEWRLDPAPPE